MSTQKLPVVINTWNFVDANIAGKYSASSLKNKQFLFKLEYFTIPVTYLFFLDSTPVSRVQQEVIEPVTLHRL